MRRALLLCLLTALSVSSCGSSTDRPRPTFSATLAEGETLTIWIDGHCGYEWLSTRINGERWRGEDLVPNSAGNLRPVGLAGGDPAQFELRLLDDTTLLVRAVESDVTHVYRPDPDPRLCE